MNDMQLLQKKAKSYSILYAEDNEALRNNATKLFKKFFSHVDSAKDGVEALETFQKRHHPILITDILMPRMDGIELARKVKSIRADTKIIIMSAHDDKELLFEAIEIGVFRFLKKPLSIATITKLLSELIEEMESEKAKQIFDIHSQNLLHYQSSMVVMFKKREALVANQMFLDFFLLKDMKEFKVKIPDMGAIFLEHDGFLYNTEERNWFDTLVENEKKLFHVKVATSGDYRHCIVKYQKVPQEQEYGIFTFEDVTELHLMELFNHEKSYEKETLEDREAIERLFRLIQKNEGKIELHNFYKGLSITNSAQILDINEEGIRVKTNFLQQKAIQLQKNTIIVSESLPCAFVSNEIASICFEKQEVLLKNIQAARRSPVDRKTVRVQPDGTESVSLFLGENKFHGDVSVEDLSLDAISLKLNALPAGLKEGAQVTIDIVLELDKKPLIINVEAKLLRVIESHYNFKAIFLLENIQRANLIKYITKRQMAIIREFKGLQNG